MRRSRVLQLFLREFLSNYSFEFFEVGIFHRAFHGGGSIRNVGLSKVSIVLNKFIKNYRDFVIVWFLKNQKILEKYGKN